MSKKDYKLNAAVITAYVTFSYRCPNCDEINKGEFAKPTIFKNGQKHKCTCCGFVSTIKSELN